VVPTQPCDEAGPPCPLLLLQPPLLAPVAGADVGRAVRREKLCMREAEEWPAGTSEPMRLVWLVPM
jgi:hypothetical protein